MLVNGAPDATGIRRFGPRMLSRMPVECVATVYEHTSCITYARPVENYAWLWFEYCLWFDYTNRITSRCYHNNTASVCYSHKLVNISPIGSVAHASAKTSVIRADVGGGHMMVMSHGDSMYHQHIRAMRCSLERKDQTTQTDTTQQGFLSTEKRKDYKVGPERTITLKKRLP